MYPAIREVSGLRDILKLRIASLVKHSTYLQETLPPSHPLLSTALFRDTTMLTDMSESLSIGDATWMTPTGIPPHVKLYKQLQNVQRSIDNLPPVLLDGMSTFIESKEVVAGNITRGLLESTIESLLERWASPSTDRDSTTAIDRPTHDSGSLL
ncbi:hypothetical protein JG687_00015310 [Phytophthora cactorum]|uniref:Uncharacterized protein n=1 Tax=Phytophthora cactorum TaxID=29920 RepID=A0A8T1TYC8_9STRA|nr:hypothetical protein JG687_00015310 [Phytophthora cactorum]